MQRGNGLLLYNGERTVCPDDGKAEDFEVWLSPS